jgi:enoyl-CoA hydratase
VVVLRGAGGRAFVAGADIKYMQGLDPLEARRWGDLGHACGELLETMPKPTIAAVDGFALGGGCELALACDLRYASARSRLGQPEINLGIIPGWGGTQRLARVCGLGFAKELILTGRLVDADEALQRGLVNAVFEDEELIERVLEVAQGLAAKSPVALAAAKAAANRALQGGHRSNLDQEATLFALLFSTEDQKEGMAAFVDKRTPEFHGR